MRVQVLEDGRHVVRERAAVVAVRPLHLAPAEVPPGRARALHEIDFLDLVLADVADDHVAVRAIEREAPRVAEAVLEDLGTSAGAAPDGGRGRDAVRAGSTAGRVDTDDLPKQPAQVLRRAERVAAAPAVAQPGVEEAIGAELQLAAVVVVVLAVLHAEQAAPGGLVRAVGGRPAELLDVDVAVAA